MEHLDVMCPRLQRVLGVPSRLWHSPDGQGPSDMSIDGGDHALNAFVSHTEAGEHVPRTVFIDLGPTGVDYVCAGTGSQLSLPVWPISEKVDAANAF